MSKTSPEPIELDIPEEISNADRAVEVIRAWIGDGTMRVSLNADAFDERMHDWGRVLGEIAHHVAQSAKLNGYSSEAEALQAVREGFDTAIRSSQPAFAGGLRGRIHH